MTLRWSPGYAAVDANFDSVSLLLHGDGTNGSTTIVDNSPSPKTVTAVGDAQISTAQSKFGGASIAFDGDGDNLTTPNNEGFSFGANDFTIEAWFYIAGNSNISSLTGTRFCDVIGTESNTTPLDNYKGWRLSVQGDSTTTGTGIVFIRRVGGGGSPTVLAYTGIVPQTEWHHVAVTRSAGSSLRIFLNGNVIASDLSFSGDVDSSGVPMKVGSRGSIVGLEGYLNGYIDDLRITKGVARYTSNFTPPTAPFPNLSPTTRLALP